MASNGRTGAMGMADPEWQWDGVTPLVQLPDIVTVVDAYGQRQYASPTIQPILGHGPASLAGGSAFDHVHPADLARLHQIFEAGVEAGHRSAGAVFRYRTADGDWFLLESKGVNLLDEPRVGAIIIDTCVVPHSKSPPPKRSRRTRIPTPGRSVSSSSIPPARSSRPPKRRRRSSANLWRSCSVRRSLT